MDIHLLALLLFCLCGQGLTDDGLSENGTDSPDRTSLEPSIPKEELETTQLPGMVPTTQGPASPAPTHDAPEYLTTPPTTVPTFTSSYPEEEGSSEEEHDECYGGQASSADAKRAVGGAIMKLGLKLLEALKPSPEQPNMIISPLSISLALSQLALGAVNETEDLLLHFLHADTLPCYHKSMRALRQQLHNNVLQIATRMYLQPGFKVKSAFKKESLRMYKSDAMPLPGLEEINRWVENVTKGHMTQFLSSLPPNLVLMLINAIHFKGQWQSRFDSRFTSKDLFFISDKEVVHVDMMLAPKYPLSLLIDRELDAQVAHFPFKQHMSFLVVIPMSGQVNVSAIAAKLNTADLYARFPPPKTMQVKLPKLKLEHSLELQEALTSMGLGDLFLRPNLAGIADGPLLVSSMQHKASMELNEDGAEASAATGLMISRSNPSFSADQPFFFALMDDKTQTPIFLGVIRNPNPGSAAMQIGGFLGGDNPDKLGFPDKNDGNSFNHIPK
ncbi:hypothetical protein AAFF_G00038560 [Aldrovandia affinis]|uniref:Serpin domain-containing protein n=1 Tax=Aldrovandia affinis TaxID=143900 RepID=A0AAD7T587_9TELE|nr:hypothetical protein AAFF_G00038560 [Aldrovandia affinis]